MASVIHGTSTSTRTTQINLIIIISDPVLHPDSQLSPGQLNYGMLGKRNYCYKTKKLLQAHNFHALQHLIRINVQFYTRVLKKMMTLSECCCCVEALPQ